MVGFYWMHTVKNTFALFRVSISFCVEPIDTIISFINKYDYFFHVPMSHNLALR